MNYHDYEDDEPITVEEIVSIFILILCFAAFVSLFVEDLVMLFVW